MDGKGESMKKKSSIDPNNKLKNESSTYKKDRIKMEKGEKRHFIISKKDERKVTKTKKRTLKKEDKVGSKKSEPGDINFAIDDCSHSGKNSKRTEKCSGSEIGKQLVRNRILDIDNKNVLSSNFINPSQVTGNNGNLLDQSFVSLPQATFTLSIPSSTTTNNRDILSSTTSIEDAGASNIQINAGGAPLLNTVPAPSTQGVTLNADNIDGPIFHNKQMNWTNFISDNDLSNEANTNGRENQNLDYNEDQNASPFDSSDKDAAEISKSVLDVDRTSVKGVGNQMSYNHFTNVGKNSTIDDMTIGRMSTAENKNIITPNNLVIGNGHPNGMVPVQNLVQLNPSNDVVMPTVANHQLNIDLPVPLSNVDNFNQNMELPIQNNGNVPIQSNGNIQPIHISTGTNLMNQPLNGIPVQNGVSPVQGNVFTNRLFETSTNPNVQISPASQIMINTDQNGQISPVMPIAQDLGAGNVAQQVTSNQNTDCFGIAKNAGVKGPYQCVNVVGPGTNTFDNNFHQIDKTELEKYLKSLTNNTIFMTAGSNDANNAMPGVPFRTITMINLSALNGNNNNTDAPKLKQPLRHFKDAIVQSAFNDIEDDKATSGSGVDLDPDKIVNNNRETIGDIVNYFEENKNGMKTPTSRESLSDVRCFNQDLKSKLFWNMNIGENGKLEQINCTNSNSNLRRTIDIPSSSSTNTTYKRTMDISGTSSPTNTTTKRFLFSHVKVHSKRRRHHKMMFPRVIPYKKRGMEKSDKYIKTNPANKTVVVKENSIDRNETVYKRSLLPHAPEVHEHVEYIRDIPTKDSRMPLTPYGSDIRGMDYPMTSKRASVPKHKESKEEKRKAESWD